MLTILLSIISVFLVYKLVECWAAARAISAIVQHKLHVQQRELFVLEYKTKLKSALRNKEIKNDKI